MNEWTDRDLARILSELAVTVERSVRLLENATSLHRELAELHSELVEVVVEIEERLAATAQARSSDDSRGGRPPETEA